MSSALHKFDHFLADIFNADGPSGVVECFNFLSGAFVITRDGLVIAADQDFLDLIEYPREELYGMSAMDLIAEDERAAMVARFAEGNTQRYELKLLLKSRQLKDVIVSPGIFYAGGKQYRLAEFIDITIQKQIYSNLKESEEKFHSVFEQAAVGIARVSPEGFFLEVNQKLCDIVGYNKEALVQKTFQEITHPDDLENDLQLVEQILNEQRHTYNMEKRYFHKKGHAVWINLTKSLVRGLAGEPKYFISVIEDISSRKEIEQQLYIQATRDSLTGLHNRGEVNKVITKELGRALRYNRSLSIFMVDIDNFKLVNDEYGHQAGDKVLVELAEILEESIRMSDIAGRYGGEEFLLILPELDHGQALLLAERIRQKYEAHGIRTEGKVINSTISIGVSTCPEHGTDIDQLIRACDEAMYKAKKQGRNKVFSAG